MLVSPEWTTQHYRSINRATWLVHEAGCFHVLVSDNILFCVLCNYCVRIWCQIRSVIIGTDCHLLTAHKPRWRDIYDSAPMWTISSAAWSKPDIPFIYQQWRPDYHPCQQTGPLWGYLCFNVQYGAKVIKYALLSTTYPPSLPLYLYFA